MKDFLFIKPHKTGTRSIRTSLQKYTCNEYGIKFKDCGKFLSSDWRKGHRTFLDYKKLFADHISDTAIIFMSIRNPWDRLVSWFFDTKKRRPHFLLNSSIDFASSVKSEPIMLNLRSLSEFSYGANSNRIHYIRLENIQLDFNIVCDKIGIPNQQLDCYNQTNHKHYTEYYDDETRAIIAEKYARDIEYFGYKFGE